MTSLEAEHFKGLHGTYSQNTGHDYIGNKKIEGIRDLLEPYIL